MQIQPPPLNIAQTLRPASKCVYLRCMCEARVRCIEWGTVLLIEILISCPGVFLALILYWPCTAGRKHMQGLLTMRITNLLPNDLNEFVVDNQSGINKPIRLITSSKGKQLKAWQLNTRDSTLNQNRNSDLGNNEGQRWSQTVPTLRTDTQI